MKNLRKYYRIMYLLCKSDISMNDTFCPNCESNRSVYFYDSHSKTIHYCVDCGDSHSPFRRLIKNKYIIAKYE
jgi:hypothetical protein